MKQPTTLLLLTFAIVGCTTQPAYDTIGQLEPKDQRFNDIVEPNTPVQIIASGFSWIEGPVWVPSEKALVFSNIQPNKLPSIRKN